MSEPSGPGDPSRPPAQRLDRAPGERYRGGRPATVGEVEAPVRTEASRARATAVVAALGVAAVGSLLFAVLSQVDLGVGLVAIAMFIGWAVALALVWNAAPIPRRPLVGAAIGAGAIVAGLLIAWGWGRAEGGALGPLEYVNERFGPIAYIEVAAAGVVAWYRSR